MNVPATRPSIPRRSPRPTVHRRLVVRPNCAPRASLIAALLVAPLCTACGDRAPDPTERADAASGDAAATDPASTDRGGTTSSRIATLDARAEATVFPVYFLSGAAVPTGGTTEIRVRVEPNESGAPAVGVIEEFIEGTGNQWQSAAWMAAFNACAAAQVPLAAYEFQVRSGGHIDGPSAGMLITATMLALLTGAELLPDATMTGTINPDGSSGPVGGIHQKMEGAKERGLKRFGYPIGCRSTYNPATDRYQDVHESATRLGLEAKEIKDLHDAYTFMTGRTLPRYAPASESDMELPETLRERIGAMVAGWQAEFDAALPLLRQQQERMPEQLRADISAMLDDVDRETANALRFEDSGMPAAALSSWCQAAVLAEITKNHLVFMEHLMRADYESMLTQVETVKAVEGRIDALRMELVSKSRRATVGGQVNAVLGFRNLVMAEAFAERGASAYALGSRFVTLIRSGDIENDLTSLQAVGGTLAQPLIHYAAAEAFVKIARQQMDLALDEGDARAADADRIGALAKGYASAAAASLGYFDALVTESFETKEGMSAAEARDHVANLEFAYPLVRSATAQAQYSRGESGDVALLRLGAGARAYLSAGSLVNKHYAIGAEANEDGTFTLSNRRALTFQLDQARLRAREAAGRCRDRLGFVPSAALTSYERGLAFREGNDDDKLSALEEFWSATFWSDLAVMLTGE